MVNSAACFFNVADTENHIMETRTIDTIRKFAALFFQVIPIACIRCSSSGFLDLCCQQL